jgi:putative zinc finger/helix-turn-helix YgiT family protein
MEKRLINCPNNHGRMQIRKINKSTRFRGIDISFQVEHYVCQVCGIEAGPTEQAAATQRAIADAYRRAVDLMTGEEIRKSRKKLAWSQNDLANRMNVGIASIKRWEGGLIQSRSMDQALRLAFHNQIIKDNYTGNRSFSIPRIKLVLKQFESLLRRKILKEDDQGLFAAKYLWYADMVAFRELGESMTGANYAHLPYGPQLNNYRELIDEIRRANESEAKPLTPQEKKIIARISMTFPEDQMIYDAAHREKILKRTPTGAPIPYTDSAELTEI